MVPLAEVKAMVAEGHFARTQQSQKGNGGYVRDVGLTNRRGLRDI